MDAPAPARPSAIARPSRTPAPVTNTTLLSSGLSTSRVIEARTEAVQAGGVVHVPEIDPRELAEKMTAPEPLRPALLDVRMQWEHRLAALPGSILIPLQDLPGRVAELDALRGREVVVYCHHGQRSLSATAFLRQRGLDARSLAGGIDRYSASVDPHIPRY